MQSLMTTTTAPPITQTNQSESYCSKSNLPFFPPATPSSPTNVTQGPGETNPTTYEDTIGDPNVGCSQIVIMRSEMDLHVTLRPMRAFCSGASAETEAHVNCKPQENTGHLNDIYNGHQQRFIKSIKYK